MVLLFCYYSTNMGWSKGWMAILISAYKAHSAHSPPPQAETIGGRNIYAIFSFSGAEIYAKVIDGNNFLVFIRIIKNSWTLSALLRNFQSFGAIAPIQTSTLLLPSILLTAIQQHLIVIGIIIVSIKISYASFTQQFFGEVFEVYSTCFCFFTLGPETTKWV